MDKLPYVVAVDIGTTSTKTLIVGLDGRIAASHAVEYPLSMPQPDYAEQDPELIYSAVLEGIRETVRQAGLGQEDVLCVSFSSAMHSLIALDTEDVPLTPMMTWADNRSAANAERFRSQELGQKLYRETGTPIHPMSPLTKLLWLKEHAPDVHARATMFAGIKDYVLAKLFGQWVCDVSLASATGMLNLETLRWHDDALALAGITAAKLPEPVPVTHRLAGLRPDVAASLGLDAGTPFVVGASDGALANLGAGAVRPGTLAVTIGTSGAVRALVRAPLVDPAARLFCYALREGAWLVGGPLNNGGVVLRWVRDELATLEAEQARRRGDSPYDELMRLAAEVEPGADGLLFLPLLAGERAPSWNANARGVYFGLTLSHGKKHMIRAALEGVMFRVRAVADALQELHGPAHEVIASGGFARSPLWRQMLADVLGLPVTVPPTVESSALGAAQLGFVAIGAAAGFEAFASWNASAEDVQYTSASEFTADSGLHSEKTVRHMPNMEHHRRYQELIPLVERIFDKLQDEFDDIAAFQTQRKRVK